MVEVFYGYLRSVARTMMTWDALTDDLSVGASGVVRMPLDRV